MRPEDERLFFEHDIAAPLTNARGASFLLKSRVDQGDATVREALEILDASLWTAERMVGWYWRLRDLVGLEPAEPYAVASVREAVAARVREEGLPLAPPDGDWGGGRTVVPEMPLVQGLLGASLTLAAASRETVLWRLEAGAGALWSAWRLRGEADALDAERLFRKVYWPGGPEVRAWLDPGLPYLKALLEPFGGSLELCWSDGDWELRAAIPLVP